VEAHDEEDFSFMACFSGFLKEKVKMTTRSARAGERRRKIDQF